MRILTIADALSSRGGLERIHLEVNRGLAKRGHAVDLLFAEGGDEGDSWLRFVGKSRQSRCSMRSGYRGLPSSLADLAKAVRFGVESRPDLIYAPRHTHLVHALTVGAVVRAPVVCHLHTPPPRDRIARRHRIVLKRVGRFVVVSRFTAQQWMDAGVPPPSMEVIHNGVDTDTFRPLDSADRFDVRTRLGIGEDTFLALYAGRLDPTKGIDVLLEAWAQLGAAKTEGRLVIAGAPSAYLGPKAEGLLTSWHRASDPASTLFLGHTPDLPRLYGAADVVVVPSVWAEPFGLVVLEAMACGTPIIASRVGGIPEALGDGFSSHLVEAGRPDRLAAKLNSLRQWRASDPGLGKRCRQHVLEGFTIDRMIDDIERLLSLTLERHRSHRGGEAVAANDGVREVRS